jgi:hypothetical protein
MFGSAGMTSVGHTLTGLTIAVGGMPVGLARRRRAALLLLCGTAANLPDFPLPGWGHHMYHVSHSLFVTAALLSLLGLALHVRPELRGRMAGWRGFILVGVAWSSHMVLDSLYSHGRGIGIFWPLSDAHLALPLPWFHTLSPPWRTVRNLHVFGLELLVYGAVLLTTGGARFWVTRHMRVEGASRGGVR